MLTEKYFSKKAVWQNPQTLSFFGCMKSGEGNLGNSPLFYFEATSAMEGKSQARVILVAKQTLFAAAY